MKRVLGWLTVVALGGAVLWALATWPVLSDVETGKTPEYPDLQVRTYSARPDRVGDAVREALSDRPGWTVVGSGQGPGGVALSLVHETPLLHFKDDVTVKIRRQGGQTVVSVRSRSRIGAWDFGQNARNIRELLAALDAELK